VYRAVDQLVGELAAIQPEAALLVFNLHGMGANHSDLASMALLSELLHREHFAAPRLVSAAPDPATGLVMPADRESWSRSMRRCYPGGEQALARKRALGRLRRIARKGLGLVRSLGSEGAGPAVNAIDWMPANWYARDWPQMDAFALPSFYDGQIRVNLEGRERLGRVPPERWQETVEALEALLSECRDPATGRPVVEEFARSTRDPATLGPTEADLIVVWTGTFAAIEHPRHGTLGPLVYRRPGGHTGGAGVALLRAPGLTPGRYPSRSAFDVVPTIFDWLGEACPDGLSGTSFLGELHA
jgi:hypothetical protein